MAKRKAKTKEVPEAAPPLSVDGTEAELVNLIERESKTIQQFIGVVGGLQKAAERIGAEVAAIAILAKEKKPEDAEPLKWKIKGLELSIMVLNEMVDANRREKAQAEGRLQGYSKIQQRIADQRKAAVENKGRLEERGKGDGFRNDGAPEQINPKGRGKKAAKKKAKRKTGKRK